MRRICVFCETWASGGIESFLTNFLTSTDMTRIRVDIIALAMKESIFTDKLLQRGIRFYELSGERNQVLRNRKLFLQIIRAQKYDVIHVNAFHSGSLYYLRLAQVAGIPLRIAHSHNTDFRRDICYWPKLVFHGISKRLFARNAVRLWACSRDAAEFMFPDSALQKTPPEIIPNGIDTARYQFSSMQRDQFRKELGLEGQFVVGNVGRLCQQKNQSFLLRVFSELVNEIPNSKLLLVGDGEDMARLKQEAGELGVAEKTIFYGISNHVEQLLWAMDTFAFPSLFEGLGIAALEAQAAGLPVICSERVPKEVFILPTVKSLPLDLGPRRWAQALVSCRTERIIREDCPQAVREKGFDIADVAGMIAAVYQNTD